MFRLFVLALFGSSFLSTTASGQTAEYMISRVFPLQKCSGIASAPDYTLNCGKEIVLIIDLKNTLSFKCIGTLRVNYRLPSPDKYYEVIAADPLGSYCDQRPFPGEVSTDIHYFPPASAPLNETATNHFYIWSYAPSGPTITFCLVTSLTSRFDVACAPLKNKSY